MLQCREEKAVSRKCSGGSDWRQFSRVFIEDSVSAGASLAAELCISVRRFNVA